MRLFIQIIFLELLMLEKIDSIPVFLFAKTIHIHLSYERPEVPFLEIIG